MATGDQPDLFTRLNSLTPASWFSDGPTPTKNAVYNGVSANLAWVYTLYAYALLQTRIATSTGVWLDRIAYDFLGPTLPRLFTIDPFGVYTYELDGPYRTRIIKEILRTRVTRGGIIQAIIDLTGFTPLLVEPWNPGDTAAYGQNAYYGVSGIYGSLSLRNQIFLTAYRPSGQGIANIAGYGFGYYGASTTAYVNLAQMIGLVTDAQIYARAASMVAAGITCWTQIKSAPQVLVSETGQVLVSEVGLGPARTNLLLWSDTFSAGAWVKTNSVVTTGFSPTPFSTLASDAWRWQRSSTAAAFANQGLSRVAAAVTYTLSIYAKPGTGNFLAMFLAGSAGDPFAVRAIFNLATGVISTPAHSGVNGLTVFSAAILPAANGFFRCSVTAVLPADTVLSAAWSGSSNGVEIDGVDSVSNTTIFAFGAQLEQSAVATNYIPTLGTQITVTDSGVQLTP